MNKEEFKELRSYYLKNIEKHKLWRFIKTKLIIDEIDAEINEKNNNN